MLVDSHCHLDFLDFAAEREAIIARGSFGYSPTPGTKPIYN